MRKYLVAALTITLVVAPQVAFASGFKIAEQSSKAAGQGLAWVATADDPTTLAMNPAGMHQLPGTQASITSAMVFAPGQHFDSDLVGVLSQDADDQLFYIPSLFVTSDFGFPKFHFGLGMYSMFGLSRDWDDVGITQFISPVSPAPAAGFARVVSRVDLTTMFVNPVFSYDLLGEKLCLAAGFIYGWGRLEINSKPVSPIPPVGFPSGGVRKIGDYNQEASGDGWSFNVGVHSQLTEKLRVGAYYRHELDLELNHGMFRIANRNTSIFGINAAAPSRFTSDLSFDGFNLPGTLGFGFAYQATPEFSFELDGEYNTWSVFNELSANLEVAPTGVIGGVAPGVPFATSASLSQHPEWEDSWAIRVGAAYKATDKLTLRAGYFWDQTPVPGDTLNPSLPDSDRHGLTLGVGFADDWWSVDLAYMAVFPIDRDVNNTVLAPQIPLQAGTYSSDPIQVIMLTSGVKF